MKRNSHPIIIATLFLMSAVSGCIPDRAIDEVAEFRKSIQRIHETFSSVTSTERLNFAIKELEDSAGSVLDRSVKEIVDRLPSELGAESRESVQFLAKYVQQYLKAVLARLEELEVEIANAKKIGDRQKMLSVLATALDVEVHLPPRVFRVLPGLIVLPTDVNLMKIDIFGMGLSNCEGVVSKAGAIGEPALTFVSCQILNASDSRMELLIEVSQLSDDPTHGYLEIEVLSKLGETNVVRLGIARHLTNSAPKQRSRQTVSVPRKQFSNNDAIFGEAHIEIEHENKTITAEIWGTNSLILDFIHITSTIRQLSASGQVISQETAELDRISPASVIPPR